MCTAWEVSGQAESNFLGIEHVRQVPGADQFDAISEDHDPDRGADKVVAVDLFVVVQSQKGSKRVAHLFSKK